MKTIENWAVIWGEADPYTPPEFIPAHLVGEIDGKVKTTSSIQSVEGRIVKTRNSEYKLGQVKNDFKKFCEEYEPDKYKNWDWENEPIRFK